MEQAAVKSCDKCVGEAVCILYKGYTKLEVQYGISSSLAPELVATRIGEALALKCNFYLENLAIRPGYLPLLSQSLVRNKSAPIIPVLKIICQPATVRSIVLFPLAFLLVTVWGGISTHSQPSPSG